MIFIHSVKHVFEKACSEEIIEEAVHNVIRGARDSKEFRYYLENFSIEQLQKKTLYWLNNYKNDKHTEVSIYDGITKKKRTIIVPTFKELCVQHCLILALEPMFQRGMYKHTYASIPKQIYPTGNYEIKEVEKGVKKPCPILYCDIRGPHQGKRFVERWIRNDIENTQYVLKMDIKHFFIFYRFI